MKYGPENSNYRHGNHAAYHDGVEVKQALAKDLLRRILTTPCDGKGDLPFPREEQEWAMQIAKDWISGENRPHWLRDTMLACGFNSTPEPLEET